MVQTQLAGGLSAINRAATGASKAAVRTLNKMSDFLNLLISSSMLSQSSKATLEEGRSANEREAADIKEIKSQHQDRVIQGKKRLKKLHDFLKAKRKAAFFGKLLKSLGIAAAVVTALATIASGGGTLAIIASALAVAGAVVSATSKSKAGQYIGLGLSLASAACGIANMCVSTTSLLVNTGQVGRTIGQGLQGVNVGVQVSQGGCTLGKGYEEGKGLDAQADKLLIEARLHNVDKETGKLTDRVDERRQHVSKMFNDLLVLIKIEHQTNLEAAGGAA
ncbi:MAG: hypothetical protein CSA65_01325 [Proteobacteria bacterium]|nr:MAG: hypothetical protein CSA65_01325 [Pseudomonadota bacterium]